MESYESQELHQGGRAPFFLGLLLLAGLIGGGAYWFLSEDQTPAVTEKAAPKTEPIAQVATPAPKATVEPSRRVFFAYDEANLDALSLKVLDQWAERLAADKLLTVQIEGHCDERGGAAYNMALGTRRGNAVRDYLVAKGINEPRLKVVSFGESRPSDPGRTESAWSANRRVELRIANVVSQR